MAATYLTRQMPRADRPSIERIKTLTDRDIPGWFPEVNRNHLIKLMFDYNVKTVLEIGAFLGKSTVFFAQRANLVCCIDPFEVTPGMSVDEIGELERLGMPSNWFAIFRDNIRQARATKQVLSCKGLSSDYYRGAATWPKVFDLVYIDGDHRYEGAANDIAAFSNVARVICGDDYDVAPGVTRAVDEAWTNPTACKAGPFWWWTR